MTVFSVAKWHCHILITLIIVIIIIIIIIIIFWWDYCTQVYLDTLNHGLTKDSDTVGSKNKSRNGKQEICRKPKV